MIGKTITLQLMHLKTFGQNRKRNSIWANTGNQGCSTCSCKESHAGREERNERVSKRRSAEEATSSSEGRGVVEDAPFSMRSCMFAAC